MCPKWDYDYLYHWETFQWTPEFKVGRVVVLSAMACSGTIHMYRYRGLHQLFCSSVTEAQMSDCISRSDQVSAPLCDRSPWQRHSGHSAEHGCSCRRAPAGCPFWDHHTAWRARQAGPCSHHGLLQGKWCLVFVGCLTLSLPGIIVNKVIALAREFWWITGNNFQKILARKL